MSHQTEQRDGVTITRSPGRVELKMSSHPATLRPVRLVLEEFCRQVGMNPRQSEELGLVLNEALANVMRHGYGGATDKPIHVTLIDDGAQVRIDIRDWGKTFDPRRLPQPDLTAEKKDPDQIKPGGLGLICMKKLMDKVEFIQQPDGMLLTMAKKFDKVPQAQEKRHDA